MQATIKMTGMVQALKSLDTYVQGARAANGPLAAWTSRLPYASFIETGRSSRQVRRAGPARMFAKGIADTAREVPAIMGEAIPKGPAAVGGAKRRIQNLGVVNIQKYTPVKTGALRASVEAVSRPRGA